VTAVKAPRKLQKPKRSSAVRLRELPDGTAEVTIKLYGTCLRKLPNGNFSMRTEEIRPGIKLEVAPSVWAQMVVRASVTAELPPHERKRADGLLQEAADQVITPT